MTTETFSMSSSSFGLIMGGITLLGLIINMVRFHLPSNKIKVLESLLTETETFFKGAIEDGLLIESSFISKAEARLTVLRHRTRTLQYSAYSATTLRKDYAEFFGGTSMAIGAACQALKNLRAEVISSSDQARCRLMEMNWAPQPSPPNLPLRLGLNPEVQSEDHPASAPVAEIPPRVCLASISVRAGTSDDTQGIATLGSNPTQIGSDVESADVQNYTSTAHTSANLELDA